MGFNFQGLGLGFKGLVCRFGVLYGFHGLTRAVQVFVQGLCEVLQGWTGG